MIHILQSCRKFREALESRVWMIQVESQANDKFIKFFLLNFYYFKLVKNTRRILAESRAWYDWQELAIGVQRVAIN